MASGQGLVDRAQRLGPLPLRIERGSAEIHRRRIRRVLAGHLLGLLQHIAPRVHPGVDPTEIEVSVHVVGLELDGAAQLPRRIQVPRLGRVCAADQVNGRRKLRVDLQHVLELDDCLVVLTLGVVGRCLLEVALLGDGRVLRASVEDQSKTSHGREG